MGKVTWKGWSKPGDQILQAEFIVFGEQIKSRPGTKPRKKRKPSLRKAKRETPDAEK